MRHISVSYILMLGERAREGEQCSKIMNHLLRFPKEA